MARGNTFKHGIPLQTMQLLHALGPGFGLGLLLLTPKAYWSRVQEGRSPFSPTLYERRRTLPRASLADRSLSWDPYLRPTPHCNSHAPEVVALADELRERAVSDWDYAQAAYDFTRNEIAYALEPGSRRGVVGTLEMGCGICVDKDNLLVALARAGGIPARYCAVANFSFVEPGVVPPHQQMLSRFFEIEAEPNWLLKKIGAGIRHWTSAKAAVANTSAPSGWHPIVELKIGGFWIPAHPALGDAEAAAMGLPLPRLGYDPLILRGVTGSVVSRSEEVSMARLYWTVRRILGLLARGIMDYVNRRLEAARARGRQILAEIGPHEYIRQRRQFYVPVPGLTELKVSPLLSSEADRAKRGSI